MKTLTAQRSILFENRIYAPGEKLPTHNAAMVDAWLSAGTAVWIDSEDTKAPAKAKPRTAEPGLAGEALASESEDGENLVGKVPTTTRRKKK